MDVVTKLVEAVGKERVRFGPEELDGYRHDTWFQSQLDDHQGRGAPRPRCVVRPASAQDVVAVVRVCGETATSIVPFGLGSGVCGGVLVDGDTIVLDMGAMTGVREIVPEDLTATFEAGVRGTDAEAALSQVGLTLGHYPQSIGVSSVGGWVATRAAGQFSTAYGNIEDMVLDVEAVMPNGDVLSTVRTPRASSGPDVRQLLLGSEGTLGVITAVTLSVRRKPEATLGVAYHVGSMDDGLSLQREIVQLGYRPPVMRQYDAVESARMFGEWAAEDQSLLLLVHEGPEAVVTAERAAVERLATKRGVRPAGEEPARHWLAERNHVPTFQSFIENGVVVDTIEIAATWTRIGGIYRDARERLSKIPGLLTGSAHSSHAYRSGVNLYFTFAAQPSEASAMVETYRACWAAVLGATADGGGGISHHHGIGRVRRDWLEHDVGAVGAATLRAVKAALDPRGIFNPGVLLPEATP